MNDNIFMRLIEERTPVYADCGYLKIRGYLANFDGYDCFPDGQLEPVYTIVTYNERYRKSGIPLSYIRPLTTFELSGNTKAQLMRMGVYPKFEIASVVYAKRRKWYVDDYHIYDNGKTILYQLRGYDIDQWHDLCIADKCDIIPSLPLSKYTRRYSIDPKFKKLIEDCNASDGYDASVVLDFVNGVIHDRLVEAYKQPVATEIVSEIRKYGPERYKHMETEKEKEIMPTIADVIFHDPATIVKWSDGTKTVVKCGENDIYDPEKGLALAIARKALGNKHDYYNVFEKWFRKNKVQPLYSDCVKAIRNVASIAKETPDIVEPNT